MPWNVSSSAPKYSPLAASRRRKPPPLIAAGIDRQADALGRLEAEIELHRPEIAAAVGRERDHRVKADVLDDRGHRAEHALDVGAEADRQAAILEAHR